ncbi:MAG TPA: phytanoyl-CoA dioxygenase family protein [Thermomicrobiales bacterium]|jgi:ectoine hydroxylase-related dioxygenase (phytanoyl-CoA dioxygenase family)|nr:phytanoyl-CoA dioxygenase family protein [Thermomicrobiales bacterium]
MTPMAVTDAPRAVTINPPARPAPPASGGREPYRVSVAEYTAFRRDGFLVVRGLLSADEVVELRRHTEDLMQGRLPEQAGEEMERRDTTGDRGVSTQRLAAPPADLSPEEKADYFLRIHMLHRQLELHERYLLHPRVLDVLQVLIGPDVLALQSMLFLKGPGKPGQGWHQDSFYIPTHADTLCGAWVAIDDCDEHNGAMWFASGSQHEPVYPPHSGYGYGDTHVADIHAVSGVSNPDDEQNDLSRIADRYPHLLAAASAGDVVFFGGHILHRSKKNITPDRFRRSFVGHYCNARSFTQWGGDVPADPETGMTNGSHILARGDTHLPFAQPRFGTPCAATLSPEDRRREHAIADMMMGDMDSGMMGAEEADPTRVDDH